MLTECLVALANEEFEYREPCFYGLPCAVLSIARDGRGLNAEPSSVT